VSGEWIQTTSRHSLSGDESNGGRTKPWGTLTLKEVETLRELLTRFESVCPDVDGKIYPADQKRILAAKKILGIKG
jgi:hypothetical protein